MNIGKRLREIRQQVQLSGNALAKRAGVAQSTISEIESQKVIPSIRVLEKLCRALGITLADFFAPTAQKYAPLTPEQRTLLNTIKHLSPEQLAVLQLVADALLRQSTNKKDAVQVAEKKTPYRTPPKK
ncbi:MAG: helix-turn-helix domain-containing protein [Peptococcaceae bacterium]|nr:helix-turn-helix domain-containing protein [Peptococcaceae bacterium]